MTMKMIGKFLFPLKLLLISGALVWGQGTAPTLTTVSATGTAPNTYAFTATVTGHSLAAPTSSVTFTDQTANRTLGTASLGAATTTQGFGNQTTFPINGGLPYFVAVGDFNGDRHPDLVTANSADDTVSVLLGKGDGTFGQQVTYGVGSSPRSVAVGDFNGDGDLDLAVANSSDNTISVLLGRGDGTFGQQVTYSVGDTPFSVAVGDFNGDGHPDLTAANLRDNTVSVLLGKGDGTFGQQVTYTVGNNARSVAVGDVNSDGHLDLVVANSNDNTVSVLLGKNDGTFGQQVTYAAGNSPFSVAVGDFNGDGHPDLALANYDGTVSVLLNQGAGTFPLQPTNYSVGYTLLSVAVGDFNGDGHPDLAVVDYAGTVNVLLNQGEGMFPSQPASYQAGGEPFSVAVGDFNGDGVPDLAVANLDSNNLSVLLNNLTHTATATLPNAAVTGTGSHTIQASYTGDGTYAASSGATSVTAALVSTALNLATPGKATAAQRVQLVASLNPYTQSNLTAAGMVTFTDTSTNTILGSAPLTTGTATLAAFFSTTGAHTIQARYAGDGNFAPATSSPQTITVTPASSFTLTPYPSTEYEIKRGSLGGFLLELQSVNNFQGSVKLSCSSGPAGSYCANLPQTVNLKGLAFAVSGLYFPPQSAPGTYTLTFTGTSGSTTVTTTAKFIVK